jgi:hypothetical protein
MSKNILNWNTQLLPVPHSRTLSLPGLETRQFGCLRFNRLVESTLFKTNLTLTKDTYVFEVFPEDKVSIGIVSKVPYLVQAIQKDFTPFVSGEIVVLKPLEVKAIECGSGSYRIEPTSPLEVFYFNVYDEDSNLVISGDGEDTIVMDQIGKWIAFENLENSNMKIKVTRL